MFKPVTSDQFLSEEDLELRKLTWQELLLYWDDWLDQAQATNEFDKDHYSHSAFMSPEEYEKYLACKEVTNSGQAQTCDFLEAALPSSKIDIKNA